MSVRLRSMRGRQKESLRRTASTGTGRCRACGLLVVSAMTREFGMEKRLIMNGVIYTVSYSVAVVNSLLSVAGAEPFVGSLSVGLLETTENYEDKTASRDPARTPVFRFGCVGTLAAYDPPGQAVTASGSISFLRLPSIIFNPASPAARLRILPSLSNRK